MWPLQHCSPSGAEDAKIIAGPGARGPVRIEDRKPALFEDSSPVVPRSCSRTASANPSPSPTSQPHSFQCPSIRTEAQS